MHTHPNRHTHMHSHTCIHRHTHTEAPSGCLSTPLLPREQAGWGRQWVRRQGRARLLNARTTLGLNGQGPGCQRALQSASAGHGLIIFLEKLGFCQVPLLQILPGAGGFPPTEARGPTPQLLRELCRSTEAATSEPTQGAQPIRHHTCLHDSSHTPRTSVPQDLCTGCSGWPFPHLQHQSFSFPAGSFSCSRTQPRWTPSTRILPEHLK